MKDHNASNGDFNARFGTTGVFCGRRAVVYQALGANMVRIATEDGNFFTLEALPPGTEYKGFGFVCDGESLNEPDRGSQINLAKAAEPLQYRKKPIVVEAFQMTEERMVSNIDWPSWLHEAWNLPTGEFGSIYPATRKGMFHLATIGGTQNIYPGDWIIRGLNGELYPCKPDVFAATYEPADKPEVTGTEGIVAAAENRPMTYGEKAVGLSFNPSGDPAVYQCKTKFAALIDQVHDILAKGGISAEHARLLNLSITSAQAAQMWAVKALTWKD